MTFKKVLLTIALISFAVLHIYAGVCLPGSYLFDLNEYKSYKTIVQGKIIAHQIDTIFEPQIADSFEEEYYLMEINSVFKGKAAKRIKLKAFMLELPKLFIDATYIIYLDSATDNVGTEFLLQYCQYNVIPKISNHYNMELETVNDLPILSKEMRKMHNKRARSHFNLHEKMLQQLARPTGTIKISTKKAFKHTDINLSQLPKYFLRGKKNNGKYQGSLSWINYPTERDQLIQQTYIEQHGNLVLIETSVLLNLK